MILVNTRAAITYTQTMKVIYIKSSSILLALLAVFSMTQASAQAPSNDLICNAIPIGCGSSVSGTTIGATNSGTGEAIGCGGWNQNTPGVWYSFLGNGNIVTLSLCSTPHDSQIAVFTGTCGAPSCLAANDDNGPACGGLPSSLAVNTVIGVTYYIKIFSWTTFTPQFNFTLNVSCAVPPTPPANDGICGATPLTCGIPQSGTTVGATIGGPGESGVCDGYAQNTPSVWYSFSSPSTQNVVVSLCNTSPTVDSQLAIFSGTCAAPVCVAANDDYGPDCASVQSSISFLAQAGVTYYIRVWRWSWIYNPNGTIGNFSININCSFTGPPNDNICSATQIVLPYNSGLSNNVGATNDLPASSTGCGGTSQSNVWYTVTGNGATFQASTCNLSATGSTNFDTEIQVFSGTCSSPVYVTCNDVANASPCASSCESVTWCSSPGTVYYISVGSGNGLNCTGNFVLSVNAVGVNSNSSLENGDFLWRGPFPLNASATPNTNDKWDVPANWLVYDSVAGVFNMASTLPDLTTNVFIPPTGGCTANYPRIYGSLGASCKDLTMLSGAKLEFIPQSGIYGSLSVSGNWMSSGQTRCVATTGSTTGGTIRFVGNNNQTISNSPETPNVSGINNFFNFEVNNTGANTGVILDFPALNYLYVANNLAMVRGNILSNNTGRLILGSSGTTSGWSGYPQIGATLLGFFNPTQATVTWSQGSVIGPMWRYYRLSTAPTNPNSLYPLGNIAATTVLNRNAWLKYPATGSAVWIRGEFFGSPPPALTGLPLTDANPTLSLSNLAPEGYWEFLPLPISANASTLPSTASATYSLDLRVNQFASVQSNYSNSRIVKAPGQNPTTWTIDGIHGSINGTASDYVITRTGLTNFSYFAIAVPPLPQAVEFIGATHECSEDGTVNFEWSTATEHNSDHFIIETSEDGVNWETLAIQQAAGNSTLRSDYRMIVPAPLNDKYYIRLTELDMDGTESVLGVFAISCNDNNDMFTYPNPSDQQFMLSIHDPKLNGEITLTVTDALGAVIAVQSGLGIDGGVANVAIELPELTPGVYFISAARDEYIRTIRHVVK
jgi:hypothetical protein